MSHTAKGTPPTHNGRIKYAEPKDLPSYPSSGLPRDGAAAGAAATLGWSNQKPVELWKPDKTSSASAAAVLAKDYKMSAQWEPAATSAGHKAASLAVGSAGVALKQHSSAAPSVHEGWGNSAATQAFHAPRPAAEPRLDLGGGGRAATQAFNLNRSASIKQGEDVVPTDAGDRSLAAAKGAMSTVRRPRSTSNPASASHHHSADLSVSGSAHALSGAALAHQASVKAKPHNEAGAVPVTTMTREMFTSHPAFKHDTDEIDQNEKLHQTAVALAKKMYNQQQKMLEQAKAANGDDAEVSVPGTYLNLQDAAYKQAQERLAKLHDEHQKNREMQEYYGNASSPRRRFSVVDKLRRRSSSEGDWEDRARSEKIRKEMSIFSTKLTEVDKTKRDSDREALMAAAQRNVKARLQGMNSKGYQGASPDVDWELKARETAQARSEVRNQHKGMIDLGGGKFMNAEDVQAIAAQRLQPWLDEVNEKAAVERERQAVLKMEEENRREEAAKEKAREKELKELNKQLKEQDKNEAKNKKLQEKEIEKARKAEEKAAKAKEKQLAKDEKRRSKHEHVAVSHETEQDETEQAPDDLENAEGEDAPVPTNKDKDKEEDGESGERTTEGQVPIKDREEDSDPDVAEETNKTSMDMPGQVRSEEKASGSGPVRSSTAKVRGWIRNRFSRGKSMSDDRKRGSFMGGASLKSGANESSASIEDRHLSQQDVTDRGEGEASEAQQAEDQVSSLSSDDLDDSNDDEVVEPPRIIKDPAVRTSSSPTRDSRFREEISS